MLDRTFFIKMSNMHVLLQGQMMGGLHLSKHCLLCAHQAILSLAGSIGGGNALV